MAIIQNKKARFDYDIEEKFEAGLELRGWEVKSIRAGGASIKEAHVFVRNGELFLLNANITPLKTASTHEKADPTRNRKLLLHKHEIMRLIGRVDSRLKASLTATSRFQGRTCQTRTRPW